MSAVNAKVVLISNLKGGSGKSTIAANLAVGLQKEGKNVYCIDIDHPQYSLFNYLSNRADNLTYIETLAFDKEKSSLSQLVNIVEEKKKYYDFIVLDTPGNSDILDKTFYNLADILIMPLNDSLMDLDLLMKVNNDSKSQLATHLGPYGQFIWDLKKEKSMSDNGKRLDWFVLRTRMSALFNKNKLKMENELKKLAKLMGFTLLPGMLERVVYKNFFAQGITVFDLDLHSLTPSQAMARQEMRVLVDACLDE